MTKSKKILGSSTGMLAIAAFSGLIAGASHHAAASTRAFVGQTTSGHVLRMDAHACKGQNSCKGQGGCASGDNGCSGKNSCKGKGGCNTNPAPAPGMMATGAMAAAIPMDAHSCKGQNSCKGQGGCASGDNGCSGKNSCKGKGGCNTNTPGKMSAGGVSQVALAGVMAGAIHMDGNSCKGQNDCKGKGGCKSGDNGCKGQNSCKGKGGCSTNGTTMPGLNV